MKNYLLDLFKTILLQVIAIVIIVWWITYATISWPSNAPNWETSWGLFQSYFSKIFDICPNGQALQWYDKNSGKKCISLNCITPTSWIHNWLTYSLASQSLAHGENITITSQNRSFWTSPANGNTSAKFTFSCNSGTTTLVSSANNLWSCATSWYIFNNNFSFPECISSCRWRYSFVIGSVWPLTLDIDTVQCTSALKNTIVYEVLENWRQWQKVATCICD